MFKHEGFKVGQIIKAYDFEPMPDRGDCYIEGRIKEVHSDPTSYSEYAHYVVEVTKRVFDGAEVSRRVGEEALVPMETLFDYDGRVTEVK